MYVVVWAGMVKRTKGLHAQVVVTQLNFVSPHWLSLEISRKPFTATELCPCHMPSSFMNSRDGLQNYHEQIDLPLCSCCFWNWSIYF